MNFCTLVRPHVRNVNRLCESDFDILARAFTNPSFYFVDRTLFALWGRRAG
jgi:hypothetical protein